MRKTNPPPQQQPQENVEHGGAASVRLVELFSVSDPRSGPRAQPNATWAWLSGAFFLFLAAIIVMEDMGQSSSITWAVRALPLGDKISHFTLFGILTYGVNRALGYPTWRVWGVHVPWVSVLILAAVSVEELSQHFFPHRTLDVDDWLADLAGIVLFTWLAKPRGAQSNSRYSNQSKSAG